MAAHDADTAVAVWTDRYGNDGSRFFEEEMHLGSTDDEWLADENNAGALFTTMGEAWCRSPTAATPHR